MTEIQIQLGRSEIQIPPLGIGTWAWGDRLLWGYGRGYSVEDVQAAFEASIKSGICFFDTAEAYGSGRSERLLGQFAKLIEYSKNHHDLVMATKFVPYPWRLTRRSFRKALKASNKRLGLEKVGLYQIHMPLPPLSVETWAKSLAEAVKEGLASTVGVSNFSLDQMRRAKKILEKEGISLASNQVNYSLLDRGVERNGLLSACKEYGIILLAYSPLAKGRLTGKYSPENPMPGLRGRMYTQSHFRKIQPLIELLREIGTRHGLKTPSQVALNWLICKGAVPIPGVKNARQVYDNVGALGWRLTEEDVADLDEVSEKL